MTVQIIRQYWHPQFQVDVTDYAGLASERDSVPVLTEGSTYHASDTGAKYISGALGWTAKPAAAAQSVAITAAFPAGEAHLGEVSHWSDLIVVTPIIAAAAFSANDVVGGKLTLAGAVRVAAGKGKITGLKLVDASKQNAPLLVFIFGADLAGSYTDNAPEAVTAADWLKWIGTIEILATDYKQMANASLVDLGFDLDVEAASGTTLYALIVTTGAPTYGANALQLTFCAGEGS